MNQNNQDSLTLLEVFRQLDTRNARNAVLAGLGLRTSADIFEAAQEEYEQARLERLRQSDARNQRNVSLAGLGIRTSANIFEAAQKENEEARDDRPSRVPSCEDVAQEVRVVESIGRPLQGKGTYVGKIDQKQSKRARAVDTIDQERPKCARTVVRQERSEHARIVGRRERSGHVRNVDCQESQERSEHARTVVRRERSDDEQMEDLASVLQYLEEEFAEKERLSHGQEWCVPIPLARKISTVQKFYEAFHDKNTLPIHTCKICYLKFGQTELQEVGWDVWMASHIEKRNDSPFMCSSCFPVGQRILACVDCVKHLRRGALSRAAQLHTQLGCEHMFPDELKGLTPVEEKLIALNSCYGFITKYSVPKGQRQNATYPKHIKGHITVFPNNVQELVTNVLPHPLLKVMDEIHVSWQGREKPAPSDLSVLLSVRRRVVERALVWLKRHNPLYANITIDTVEMDSWEAPAHGVPSQIYGRLERNEPSAWEKARTGQVVPPTERGLEDIREIMATLGREREANEEGDEDGEVNDDMMDFDSAS